VGHHHFGADNNATQGRGAMATDETNVQEFRKIMSQFAGTTAGQLGPSPSGPGSGSKNSGKGNLIPNTNSITRNL
jgi:hypothetical protein